MGSVLKVMTIVGARPQFIKAAMVSRAIIDHNSCGKSVHIDEQIIHTGQHFDANMSDIFFEQMGIPQPVVNLHAGTGLHGEMTGRMLAQLESEVIARKPDYMLVYGDTNSTLAGALAASKLHVPVAHVEAGLRSFNKKMPEEINRILTDHVSSLLLCPTTAAMDHLKRENIVSGVHHVGDVMYDAALVFGQIAEDRSSVLADHDLHTKEYYLTTLHRAENTDDAIRLRSILEALGQLTTDCPVVLPLHPRTAKSIKSFDLEKMLLPLTILPPVSFLDMVMLEKHARCILTDSGGVQKEACFHGVPCATMRDETEWVETVQAGWNMIVGADSNSIVQSVRNCHSGSPVAEYGSGDAAACIANIIGIIGR